MLAHLGMWLSHHNENHEPIGKRAKEVLELIYEATMYKVILEKYQRTGGRVL